MGVLSSPLKFRRDPAANLNFAVPVYLRPVTFMRPSYRGVLKLRFQTALYNNAVIAKENFKKARKDKASEAELTILSAKSAALALATLKHSTSVLVTPESDDAIIDQVQKNELVHPVADREELLGRLQGGRDCLSRIIDTEQGPKVLGYIFRAHMRVGEVDGRIPFANYPSDIDAIKKGDIEGLGEKPNLTAYFAISSKWFGSGPQIIKDLDKEKLPGCEEVTTSPMRDFTKKHRGDVISSWSNEEFDHHFIDHLQNGVVDETVRDGVYGFHGHENGALVANIHRNVGRSEPIVNYLYLRPMAGRNIERLNDGLLPVTPHVYARMSNQQIAQGAYNISNSPFAPK